MKKDNINGIVPCVELRDVTKRFPGIVAVDQVSIQVEKGEIFSLLGPSGCGKTTTLRLIGGLEEPDEGEILIDGEVVNDLPPYKRDCSIVFQNLALFPHMTVEENIAFGLERRRVPKGEIRRRIGEILDLVKLGGMERRRPDQLSGGQQQRVALARSLVLQPKVLLLDEPLASLDRKLRKEMQVELKRIQAEVGTTFLYVTHDQKVALAISNRIAIMRDGRIVQLSSPYDIFEHPQTKFVADFMGMLNIFKVILKGREGNLIQVETEKGSQIFVSATEGIEAMDPDSIYIAVRPEKIKIFPIDSDEKGINKLPGIIKEKVYQGDFSEFTIVLEGGDEITAHPTGESPHFHKGDRVLVCWDPVDSQLLNE